MSPSLMTIGRIARRTGVSAKALRLYEASGLPQPERRSPAGWRLYGATALKRLQKIVLLRRAGFSLGEIGDLLDGAAARDVLLDRIARIERELARQSAALAALHATLRQVDDASAPALDQLLENIAMTTQLDVQLTEPQRRLLAAQREKLGDATLAQAQRDWPLLIAEVRAAIDAGTAPEAPSALALARRWHALVQLATAGDAGIGRKIGAAYDAQPQAMAAQGMDRAMFAWIGRGMAAAGLSWSTSA